MNEWDRLRRQAERNKKLYPPGTRIEMDHMNDPFAPIPNGTKGTVVAVDDIGQLIMAWDNCQTLAVNTDEDSFHVITGEEQDESVDIAPVMRM